MNGSTAPRPTPPRKALIFASVGMVLITLLATSGRGAWAADTRGSLRGTVPTPTPKVTPTKPPTPTPVPSPAKPPTPTRTIAPTRTACVGCPTPEPLTAGEQPLAILVNTGGPHYTDSMSQTWYGDQQYIPGTTTWGYVVGDAESGEFATTEAIAGTADPFLYQDERWGMTGYRFEVANGPYRVTLMWAEQFVTGPGERVFSIKVQNQMVLKDFDIFTAAGGRFKAVSRVFTTTVSNQLLMIDFVWAVENPTIAAIAVEAILPPTPAPTATLPPSPTPTEEVVTPTNTPMPPTPSSPGALLETGAAPATPTPTPTSTATPLPTEARAVAVFPQNESTLRSAGGGVLVRIPVGAVAEAVQLVHVPEKLWVLPPANPGFVFGSQTFTLLFLNADGRVITQTVLQQPITLVVRYSDDDLALAGGEAGRLVLLQYRPEGQQWVALQAQANTATQTLTWRTQTLGQFALAIRQGATPRTQGSSPGAWRLALGVLVAFVIGGLVGYRLRDVHSTLPG